MSKASVQSEHIHLALAARTLREKAMEFEAACHTMKDASDELKQAWADNARALRRIAHQLN